MWLTGGCAGLCSARLLSRIVFCSGLGDLEIFSKESCSSKLSEGCFSINAALTETEPLGPAPTGGDFGLASALGNAPLSVGILDDGPSEDLILRVACGKALPGCFLEDLKKNDIATWCL